MDGEAEEAKDANAKGAISGCVASAVSVIGEEFVKHRMPPLPHGPGEGDDDITMATPSSVVSVVDPGALVLIPAPGAEDGSCKLVHCTGNSRRNHMMNHPESFSG